MDDAHHADDGALLRVLPRLFHTSHLGGALVSRDGRLLVVNEAMAAMLGRTPDELHGRPLAELLAHDGTGRTSNRLADQAAGGGEGDLFGWYRIGPDLVELPLQHREGRLVWLRAWLTTMPDDGPDSGVTLLSAIDVTDRRALRDATADSAARLALDAAADGILLVDGSGRIRSVNARVRDLFGYEPQELLGEPIEVLVPMRLRDVHTRYRSGYLQDPRTRPMGRGLDLTARRKDGSEFPVEISLGALREEGQTMVTCVITDISQRKRAEEQLAFQATHDQLTGLPNRSLFVDRLHAALAYAERHRRAVAVLFMDLDRFKLVNDSLGHGAGDEVLAEVGKRLASVVRAQDTAARFGGDEFAVLCTDIEDEGDAIRVAERLLGTLSDPIVLGEQSVVVTPSIGIAIAPPEPFDADRLVSDADTAMYTAKRRGRGRYELFDDRVRARALERLAGAQALRDALERGELRLVYQPVISLESNQVVGVEALLRWQRPERGLVAPAEFINLAEETGLIVPIGDWVLNEACHEMGRLQPHYPTVGELGMAVNLGAVQLLHGDLVPAVSDALRSNHLSAGALTVEVAESSIEGDGAHAARQLHDLGALGVSLAVDDFGTGSSSLRRLRQLSVDTLKIDRSFVAGLDRSDDDLAIVTAVIDLAHALGAATVAEGVETTEQLEVLRRLGCDYAQGYLFSRPVPAEELLSLLAASPPA